MGNIKQVIMKILRIFPRRTKATPTDDLAIVNRSPELWDEADKIWVSVTFDWDKERAEQLAKEWQIVAPVEIGGPAMGSEAGEFVPGRFLKMGYTITSRGCPFTCRHCLVPKREGHLRVYPIKDGWDVLDNNLLACPESHIRSVFQMLERQPFHPRFTGGIDASLLKPWHIDWFLKLKPKMIWLAYDAPNDWEPLYQAIRLLKDAGIGLPHKAKCVGAYVLMGYAGDTLESATKRLSSVISLGIRTQAMLFDNGRECQGSELRSWRDLRKKFTNAAEVGAMIQESWKVA